MGYCDYNAVQSILPENVRIGDQNIGTPTPGRVATGRSNISIADSQKYIIYAGAYIDGRLKSFYVCPLRRIKGIETEVLNSLNFGTNVNVIVNDSGTFTKGEVVRIQDNDNYETANVSNVPNMTTVTLDILHHNYSSANNLRISILEYPDPVPLICARMAASFILDRLYVNSQAPDVSAYGSNQRNQASMALDDILKGTTVLNGQEHVGYRFIRATLLDRQASPAEVTKGEEKE